MCFSSHRAAFGSGTLYIKIRDTTDTAIQHDTADTVDTADNTATISNNTVPPAHTYGLSQATIQQLRYSSDTERYSNVGVSTGLRY